MPAASLPLISERVPGVTWQKDRYERFGARRRVIKMSVVPTTRAIYECAVHTGHRDHRGWRWREKKKRERWKWRQKGGEEEREKKRWGAHNFASPGSQLRCIVNFSAALLPRKLSACAHSRGSRTREVHSPQGKKDETKARTTCWLRVPDLASHIIPPPPLRLFVFSLGRTSFATRVFNSLSTRIPRLDSRNLRVGRKRCAG